MAGMKRKMLNNAFAILTILPFVSSSSGSCPSVCACKWKGGKQAVECLERALITVPEDIDGETQVLDMSGNNLQIVPRETFYRANLTNLQRVYLKNCRIGQIGDRAFRGLTNLIELDLSQNLLTAVPSATFEDTPFLRYLSLAGNPIQKIDSNAFGTVLGMAKIDLSHCEIQIVSPNAFEKLESLEWLKLNGNKLTELDPKTVETIRKLHGIELHDNPWACDCKLRPVKEWLSRYNVPHPVDPICRRPERLFGRPFGDLAVDDFACKPEMLPSSRYVEAAAGENATVSCRVAATPSANVHWYWGGRLLLNNSAFSAFQKVFILEQAGAGGFEKTSSLTLTNALETDSGEFYCVAENRAGTAEANFTLNVSLRTAGLSSLGSGQIAGLTLALAVLVSAALMVASVLMSRFRRSSFSESKTPARSEVIVTMNGNGIAPAASAAAAATTKTLDSGESEHFHSANPVRKPPRKGDSDGTDDGVRRSPTENNPDVVRDARPDREGPARSGAARDSLRPPSGWERERPAVGDEEERRFGRVIAAEYPPDYGLPIPGQPADARTLRVWQKGIPVLPPTAALKRVLPHSRNSPDEGYQEGCGTDV